MFEAGSDTTTSITISLFLACANDPSIAKEACVEIDRVVGEDRMPTFADLKDLPCAFDLTLTLRWFLLTRGLVLQMLWLLRRRSSAGGLLSLLLFLTH